MREYLKVGDAKEGQLVELDGGFTCVEAGKTRLHAAEDGALYFDCNAGRHFIVGQEESKADGSLFYVGIWPVED